MKWWWIGGLCLLAAGCVIIIQPGSDTPTPVPLPLQCSPGLGDGEVPTVHIFFATRVERSTVNLADRYGEVMQDVGLGLAALGANVETGVLIREDERRVAQPILAAWGCALDSPEALAPADVIRWYATETDLGEDVNLGCAIDPLVTVGAHLADAVTQYPTALPGTSGRSIFGSAPDLVLVVHLDALARKTGFEEAGCDTARAALEETGADGQAAWLDYAGGISQDKIVHWFFTTEEQVPRDAFVAACKQVDGFPSSVLDTLEESKKALYGPMGSAVNDAGGDVARLSMCRMLVQGEERAFLKAQLAGLAKKLGLNFDEQRLKDVLNGGLGALLNPPGEAGGLALPEPRSGG